MKKKTFLIILFGIFIIFASTTKVKAIDPTPIWPYKFSRGVSNTCYYIDSSASGYTNFIDGAANNWEITGFGYNPIYMTKVSSSYATHMDIYGKHDSWFSEESMLGQTTHYSSNSYLMWPDEGNWFFTIICIDVDDFPLLTVGDQQGTIAHEMGHAFGLKHYDNNRYSIMYPYVDTSLTTVIQQCDHDAINIKYGR